MHTPGHAVINLAAISRCTDASVGAPILAGAILPDVPIVLLYIHHRWLRGVPEAEIWTQHYQRPAFLYFVHVMHSIPLSLAGLVLGIFVDSPALAAFFGSLLLHAASDLPLHGEDAHRHFLPFSHFRFISPISYWDVRRHARWVALVEATLVWIATVLTWPRAGEVGRVALVLVALGYVVSYWRSFIRPAYGVTRS
ncbi:hypothetical protein L6R52_18755 [Myxococcota bacterium]|nr:hypothetical protein [Myxococcota bacterium]